MATPATGTSQASSEAIRLADIFQEINTWAGNPNKAGAGLTGNFSINRTYIGPEVSKAFKSIMYDGDDFNDLLPNRVDNLIAWGSVSTKALDLYYRYKFLVGYLEDDKGTQEIKDFIKEIREDKEASPHWKITSKETEFNLVWQTLWIVLNFSIKIKINANTFQGQIHKLFPPPPPNTISTIKFEINLKDLESVDIRVKPTSHFNEHLLLEGNTLNVLKVDFEELNMLKAYKDNKAAKELGIANLGEEILSSLYALYVKDEFWNKAGAAGLLSSISEVDRILSESSLRTTHGNTLPQVLNYRAHILQKQVNYRRSWWPSLVRDIKKQIEAQPVLFYGAVLAVFFGICSIIQTIASVWSLVLALRAAN